MPNDLNDVLKPLRDAAEEVERGFKRSAIDAFVAGAAHALTHPIILRTAEELAALPVGSVVLDWVDRAYVRSDLREGWSWVAHDGYAATHDGLALAASGPIELIRLPAEI
ncbi:hypothetical protein [Nesterenkonia sp. HG001]|uniref:hypothetical protein n=1 Tax=Nesterenkonia sp. HG001 TaxID=2983207 RepID=UPI002AC53911|nr:hypothetical protein [Nesterenkonia sp. HG001]MDZ5076757.1 hypothetical protein [Nesterenkonia sp. HG001]